MGNKICTKCNLPFPKSNFYKHKNGKEGLNPVCKVCWKNETKKYEENNPRVEYRKNRYEGLDKNILNENARKRTNKRYKSDINFKILTSLRSRIHHALKGHVKSKNSRELIGISIEGYKKYFEGLFKEGMNWDNHGEWEIDHIKPCSSFNLDNPLHQKECFHYTNTQPLWKTHNRQKSDKQDYLK